MRIGLLFCFLLNLFISSALFAQGTNAPIQIKGKTPQGVTIRKNKVTINNFGKIFRELK